MYEDSGCNSIQETGWYFINYLSGAPEYGFITGQGTCFEESFCDYEHTELVASYPTWHTPQVTDMGYAATVRVAVTYGALHITHWNCPPESLNSSRDEASTVGGYQDIRDIPHTCY